MSDSSLVQYKSILTAKEPRNHAIDTITIHCTAGQSDIEPIGIVLEQKGASCNYAIDRNGRIGLFVPENYRSFCSSSASNDHRAITIEVASDMYEPCNVREAPYNSLIKLLVDICKRNGIKKLLWKADKSLIGQVDKQNMTVHRWFHSGKSCPGEYLYSRMGKIADEVNAQLETAAPKKLYRVQIGAFSERKNAENYLAEAKKKGFSGFIVEG